MAKKKKPQPADQHVHVSVPPAGLARVEEHEVLRDNAFDGLTERARHALAVDLIREAWGGMTNGARKVGDVVFIACYEADPEEALGKKADKNARYQALVKTLGTLDGGPSERVLSVARRLAAATRAVQGPFWKTAPYTHKEALIVLSDPEKLEEGAKHAVELSWTVEQTQAWVDRQRRKKKVKRGKSASGTSRSCLGVIEAGKPDSLDRIAGEYAEMTPAEQKKFRDALDQAREAILRLRKRVGDGES